VLPYGKPDQEEDREKSGSQTGEIDPCGEKSDGRVATCAQDDKQDQHNGAEYEISRIPVFMDFCMYGACSEQLQFMQEFFFVVIAF